MQSTFSTESAEDSDSSESDDDIANQQWLNLRNKIKTSSIQESKKLQQDHKHPAKEDSTALKAAQKRPLEIRQPQKQSRSVIILILSLIYLISLGYSLTSLKNLT